MKHNHVCNDIFENPCTKQEILSKSQHEPLKHIKNIHSASVL